MLWVICNEFYNLSTLCTYSGNTSVAPLQLRRGGRKLIAGVFPMRTRRAMFAGLAGALAMSASMAVLRVAGVHTDLEGILGSLVLPNAGAGRWLVGFLVHLALGAVVACLYAACFEFAVQRAGKWVGAGIGLSHGLLAGLCMSGIAEMNPLIVSVHSSTGAFFQNISPAVVAGPMLFMLLHVLFGVVVGAVYGETLEKTHVLSEPVA